MCLELTTPSATVTHSLCVVGCIKPERTTSVRNIIILRLHCFYRHMCAITINYSNLSPFFHHVKTSSLFLASSPSRPTRHLVESRVGAQPIQNHYLNVLSDDKLTSLPFFSNAFQRRSQSSNNPRSQLHLSHRPLSHFEMARS